MFTSFCEELNALFGVRVKFSLELRELNINIKISGKRSLKRGAFSIGVGPKTYNLDNLQPILIERRTLMTQPLSLLCTDFHINRPIIFSVKDYANTHIPMQTLEIKTATARLSK